MQNFTRRTYIVIALFAVVVAGGVIGMFANRSEPSISTSEKQNQGSSIMSSMPSSVSNMKAKALPIGRTERMGDEDVYKSDAHYFMLTMPVGTQVNLSGGRDKYSYALHGTGIDLFFNVELYRTEEFLTTLRNPGGSPPDRLAPVGGIMTAFYDEQLFPNKASLPATIVMRGKGGYYWLPNAENNDLSDAERSILESFTFEPVTPHSDMLTYTTSEYALSYPFHWMVQENELYAAGKTGLQFFSKDFLFHYEASLTVATDACPDTSEYDDEPRTIRLPSGEWAILETAEGTVYFREISNGRCRFLITSAPQNSLAGRDLDYNDRLEAVGLEHGRIHDLFLQIITSFESR